MSINIGLTIAISASVSRALGSGDRTQARRLAASGLLLTTLVATVLAALLWIYRDFALDHFMHARGEAAEVASGLLAIIIPANVPMGLGMALSGVLRACGDARRAMYVTLSGGVVTAFTDPALIFGLGLGVYGAAWATLISRLVFLWVGYNGAVRVHHLVGRPNLIALGHDFRPLAAIGLPSIMANLATPVSAIYVTRVWSDFGEATVAGGAIVDRVIPLAFGVIFALTGSIGPIIGQNFGARLMPRVRRALTDSFDSRGRLCAGGLGRLGAARAVGRRRFRGARRQRGFRAVVLPLRRDGLGVHHLPVRRQHRLQQSRLRADGDAVQLGAGDARHDSVRDPRRALRRRAGGDDGPDRRRGDFWDRRGRDGLCARGSSRQPRETGINLRAEGGRRS